MVFKEIDNSMWKPEKDGDKISGILLKKESDVGANKSQLYTLEVEGSPVGVWGSAILDQRMVAVKVGDLVRITFKGVGEAKGGHNPPKIFKVEVDKE